MKCSDCSNAEYLRIPRDSHYRCNKLNKRLIEPGTEWRFKHLIDKEPWHIVAEKDCPSFLPDTYHASLEEANIQCVQALKKKLLEILNNNEWAPTHKLRQAIKYLEEL